MVKFRKFHFKICLVILIALIELNTTAFAAPTYKFPVQGCSVKFTKFHHDYPATDIIAKRGCAVVAVINGTVDEVSSKDLWNGKSNLGQDRGGLSISIIGEDGVRYYGSHLSKIESGIAVGVKVSVGQKIGEVGNTGSARGTSPHLHFGISWPTDPGIWWVRRGMINPARYLTVWKTGKDLSPVDEVEKLKIQLGTVPPAPKK